MSWFTDIGGALSGWVALGTAACVVVGGYLYARFATKKQVEQAMQKAESADGALAEKLVETEKALEQRVVDLEKAAERLNIGLRNTPTRAEHQELRVEMTQLGGRMDVLSERLEGMTDVIRRVERPLNLLVEHHMGARR